MSQKDIKSDMLWSDYYNFFNLSESDVRELQEDGFSFIEPTILNQFEFLELKNKSNNTVACISVVIDGFKNGVPVFKVYAITTPSECLVINEEEKGQEDEI